ncbi:SRPBCC family protein [Phenylobacterium sp.]|uniref:SRPBCC family protein n=1 Tax=Phenylobacterium sp. TaxID=1871053 RepID=UPI00121A5B35|nr:SRPBCC family protein [Phenylobacterium sp.]THD57829.1 MAG: polyketide cyclase [Phenylobacterium sp.]
MDKPSFVYVTYIVTTPQKVWDAITDAELSGAYWQRSNVSDWKVGSAWTHGFAGKPADLVGEVLETDPPTRLVLSWTPASQVGNPERTSRVAFDIEPLGEKVRLTVTHTELTPEGLKDISQGWPAVLANMKTYLETGRPMPDAFGGIHG